MPTFCRHNHLIQNCPICSREQAVELRPVLSSSAPKVSQPRPAGATERRAASARPSRAAARRPAGGSATGGLRVRRLARGEDDGFASSLVPGLKSSLEARRLAEEIAFSAHRLETLQSDPPGLYASIADPAGELEERTWLAFLVAYLGPLDADPDPFAAIRQAHVPWSSGELPRLEGVEVGPRGAHDPARGTQTVQGYRNWALRAGSQAAAFAADPSWTSERRLERVFERLALPGLHRGARFELLLTLGALGVYELTAGSLRLGGSDEVTVAAKRALGIGDPMLLERRAAELAAGCAVPLGALDLALFNWGRGQRSGGGVPADGPVPAELLERLNAALGL